MEKLLTIKFSELMGNLKSQQLITEEKAEEANQLINTEEQEAETPWYIYGMIGAAAWLSAVFLLIFLFGLKIIEEKTSSVAGVALCTAAIVLRKEYARSIFLDQLSLAANVAGQFLIIFGYSHYFGGNVLGICSAIVVMQIAMSYLYQHPLQHFAAPHIIAGTIFVYFMEKEFLAINHILITGLAISSIFMMTKEAFLSKWKCYKALTFGVVTCFLASLIVSIFPEDELASVNWWITSILMSTLLLYVQTTIFQQYNIALESSRAIFIMLATIIVCAISYNSPGIIASLLVIVLTFSRGDYTLTSLAFLSFASFLFFYYYNLNLSLLQKSWVLMGTGFVLLLFRTYYVKNFVETTNEK